MLLPFHVVIFVIILLVQKVFFSNDSDLMGFLRLIVCSREMGFHQYWLPRKEFLAEIVWLLFDRRKPHLYFRGPADSGKTQFLILLAQELLKLGHAIYFVPDLNVLNDLNDLKSSEFEALNASAAKEKGHLPSSMAQTHCLYFCLYALI